MDLKESKFDLEQAASEVYEKAEQIYKGSEINQDTLTGVLHRFFKDTFTARQLQALEDYFEEQEKIFYDMYGGDEDLQENKEIKEEAVENTIPGLENYENIADSFDNYKAYEANFGPLVIVKVNKIYYIFKTTAQDSNDFIQYTTSKDYVNGWLYGAVQCKNRLLENKKVEEVNKQRIPTSELPDFCYSYNDTTGEIIVIKKGVEGYYPSEIRLDDTLVGDKRKAEAEKLINEQNEILGVTEDQKLQMELNSMFGWDKVEESKLYEVLEVGGEDISIDSIFHFPNVIYAMQETCREAIMELQAEDKSSVTEKDIRVIYNELSKMEDIVNNYLEKANPDEGVTESKKVTETIDGMQDFEKQDDYPEIDLSLYNTEAQEALIFIENHINTLSKEQIHELADKVFMEDIYTIKDFMKYLVTSDNDDIVEIAQEFKKYLPESEKVTEGYVIGLSTKTVRELAEDEVYDKYVQDINDGPAGTLNITTTDNIENALQIEEKFDAYTLADEIKERYPEWNSVVAFFK